MCHKVVLEFLDFEIFHVMFSLRVFGKCVDSKLQLPSKNVHISCLALKASHEALKKNVTFVGTQEVVLKIQTEALNPKDVHATNTSESYTYRDEEIFRETSVAGKEASHPLNHRLCVCVSLWCLWPQRGKQGKKSLAGIVPESEIEIQTTTRSSQRGQKAAVKCDYAVMYLF